MKAASERVPRSIDNYVTGGSERSQRTDNLKYDGYEPRAAFYTDKKVKKQKINMHIASTVRKNFQLHFQYNATSIKKSWKSGEELS